MGQGRGLTPCAICDHQRIRFAVFVRPRRHDVLRKLYERWRMRLHVASLLRQRCLGSVCERRLGLVSGRRLLLGISVSLGMDSVSSWQLVLLFRRGLGMATGGFMERAE